MKNPNGNNCACPGPARPKDADENCGHVVGCSAIDDKRRRDGRSDWWMTATGRTIWVTDFRTHDITCEDICLHLSNVCRFGGASRFHYSVAQHSVLVAEFVERAGASPQIVFEALMHDAAEAYLGDVIRPLKRVPEMLGYIELEDHYEEVIAHRYGLTRPLPELIKTADREVLLAERAKLTNFPEPIPADPEIVVKVIRPDQAAVLWREKYKDLIIARRLH